MRFKKSTLIKVTAVALCLVGLGIGANAEKVTVATEQAIAGIGVSLDDFSTASVEEEEESNKTELATEAAVADFTKETEATSSEVSSEELESEVTTELVAGEVVAEDDSSKKEETKEDSSEKKEVKETEAASDSAVSDEEEDRSNIKLNLVYDRLGMAKVDTYLNVRKHPSDTAKIVGKMTKHSGCNIYKIKDGWAKIVSGKVNGYVKAKFLYTDDEALERALKVATLRANVKTTTLNVRFLPSTDSRIYDLISKGSDYDIEKLNISEEWMDKFIEKNAKKKDLKLVDKKAMKEDLENWACINIDDELCFVSKEFIKTSYKVDRAVTIDHKKKSSKSGSGSGSGSGGNQSIVDYAMQFLGNPYVWGGTSLTNGCDCSGFTMSLYAAYGVALPHFAASQASMTRSVSSSEAQPGDLFFYGSGEISHVAMYIGNGQIIHASNSRTGIIISNAFYRTPVKIGRVG